MGSKHIVLKIIGALILISIGIWFLWQPAIAPDIYPTNSPTPIITTEVSPEPNQEITPTTFQKTSTPKHYLPEPTATPTFDPLSIRPTPGSVCRFDPDIVALIEALPQDQWVHWIKLLSGEEPVNIEDETYTILTRFSESMFSGDPDARAFDFVVSQLRQWGYEDDVDLFIQEFKPFTGAETSPWKNIIVVIPGSDPQLSHEQVLLTAHLDSITQTKPEERAPGADDNGSGVATLLEAARIFRDEAFKRTIKIVFFSGEEVGLHGSRAYVIAYSNELDDIVGVFNADMFGYDGDNDRCFEIHVGWMKDSNLVAGCLIDTIENYDLDLKYDYMVKDAIGASDHSTFWSEEVGAIEVLENFFTNDFQGGCSSSDMNPYYHTEDDLVEYMNIDTGHDIARALIAAVAGMAEIVEN